MCNTLYFSDEYDYVDPDIDEKIDKICQFMDDYIRRGELRNNKLIVEIILGYAHMALGDDDMLDLLQEMENHGDINPWALDCTRMNELQLQIALRDGDGQLRYYREPLSIGGYEYYISSQWYSHFDHPWLTQTKKALLQLIIAKIPEQYKVEYFDCLENRVRNHIK